MASTREGPPKVAPLVSAAFNASVIPSVAYIDPDVGCAGLAEDEAKAHGIKVKNGHGHGKILGGGMVGTHAGDMIGEVALAIEMRADAIDIGKTIYPHPTALCALPHRLFCDFQSY